MAEPFPLAGRQGALGLGTLAAVAAVIVVLIVVIIVAIIVYYWGCSTMSLASFRLPLTSVGSESLLTADLPIINRYIHILQYLYTGYSYT